MPTLEHTPTPTDDLKEHVGKTFLKERHGTTTAVILTGVKRNKVVLRFPDRVDSFSLSIEEFRKYYRRPS
jgi:hypothetical protein